MGVAVGTGVGVGVGVGTGVGVGVGVGTGVGVGVGVGTGVGVGVAVGTGVGVGVAVGTGVGVGVAVGTGVGVGVGVLVGGGVGVGTGVGVDVEVGTGVGVGELWQLINAARSTAAMEKSNTLQSMVLPYWPPLQRSLNPIYGWPQPENTSSLSYACRLTTTMTDIMPYIVAVHPAIINNTTRNCILDTVITLF